MEIEHSADARLTITAYATDHIVRGGRRIEHSCLLLENAPPARLPARLDLLEAAHLQGLDGYGAEVVLVGTGPRQRFPTPDVTGLFARRGLAIEVMDLGAACRTYNVLIGMQRRVAAFLFLA